MPAIQLPATSVGALAPWRPGPPVVDETGLQPAPRLRLLLRGWGVPEGDLAAIAGRIGGMDARLGCMAEGRDEDGGRRNGQSRSDLVIHLIDLPSLAGARGRSLWNACGPVEAMRLARAVGRREIALCRGPAGWLPADRSGCWILAGTRHLGTALDILVRAAIAPALAAGNAGQASQPDCVAYLVDADMTGVLLHYADADTRRMARQLEDDVLAALRRSLVMPCCVMLSESTSRPVAFPDVGGLAARSMRLYRHRREAPSAPGADLLLCFPSCEARQGAPLRAP